MTSSAEPASVSVPDTPTDNEGSHAPSRRVYRTWHSSDPDRSIERRVLVGEGERLIDGDWVECLLVLDVPATPDGTDMLLVQSLTERDEPDLRPRGRQGGYQRTIPSWAARLNWVRALADDWHAQATRCGSAPVPVPAITPDRADLRFDLQAITAWAENRHGALPDAISMHRQRRAAPHEQPNKRRPTTPPVPVIHVGGWRPISDLLSEAGVLNATAGDVARRDRDSR